MATSEASESPAAAPAEAGSGSGYQVVARRYRPQRFADLVGQEHVARGLSGAIESGRVGHAYLFTGARGVGKTSAARIYAKALNCEQGPAAEPCNACDACRAITAGQDVDVVEIDAASNRGIDEIRQLRQNVAVRPARGRCKVYIIDEVHMLTREAFNALLKTLEEPPDHVKFIFCTTDPQKMPITILSRCQRYDFAGIITASISARLAQIAQAEGVEAEGEALEILARRGRVFRRLATVEGGFPGLEEGAAASGIPPGPAGPDGEGASILSRTPERVEIACDAAGPRLLVLADAFYPGWRAEVDGAPVPVWRANRIFRGVAVPAGAHRVVFVYRPLSFRIGVLLSLLSLAVAAAAGVRAIRLRRTGAGDSLRMT